MGAEATLRAGWTPPLLDYELPEELIAQRPPGTTRRLAPARIPTSVRANRAPALRRASRPSGTRAGRRQRHARAPGAATSFGARPGGSSRCSSSRSARMGSGRAWLDRRGACESGERLGPIELVESLGGGRWLLRLEGSVDGDVPLPPYIREPLADPERYQTVYAQRAGLGGGTDRGAPLHPGAALAARLRRGHSPCRARHVPTGLRRSPGRACAARRALSGRAGRVGADSGRRPRARGGHDDSTDSRDRRPHAVELAGRTDLFITPGFEFRRVDELLTNFHLPRSSLLALVMAFVGVEETREIYRAAIAEQVSLLLLRRCHADPVTSACLAIGTLSARSRLTCVRTFGIGW